MLPNLVLLAGIASVATAVGYMAGSSGTPVAAVAIPAVFGLAVTALGLLQATQPSKDLLEFIRSLGKDAETQPDIVEFRQRARSAPLRVGVALTVFSLCYLVAANVGASVRINGWLVDKPGARPFPWQGADTAPPTIAAALEWLALQSRLSDLGYTDAQITALYVIQTAEWQAAAAAAAAAEAASAAAAGAATAQAGAGQAAAGAAPAPVVEPVVPGTDALWRDWLRQRDGGPGGNPFANQPPRDLIDRLREMGTPGGGAPPTLPG